MELHLMLEMMKQLLPMLQLQLHLSMELRLVLDTEDICINNNISITKLLYNLLLMIFKS